MIETHAPRTRAIRKFAGWTPSLLCIGLLLYSLAGCASTSDSKSVAAVEPAGAVAIESGLDLFFQSQVDEATEADEATDAQTPDDDRVQRVAAEVSLALQERRLTAQWLLSQANKLFAEADYSAAERAYRRALDSDPSLQEAKTNLARCLMFLGRRDGEIRTILQQFGEEVRVLEQQRLSEASRFLAEGRQALEENRNDEALDLLQRARERLIWFEYGVDVTEMQLEAQALYDRARNLKISSDEASRRDREEFSLREARRLTTEAEKRRL
ncbi:MAG: tetratricopeptide repeat protein, partial [Planctomycetota bacterium]